MTPTELLAATAADMRAVADDAQSFIGSGTWPANLADGPYETHATAWDPEMARAVADWLDSKAVRYAFPDNARLLDADLRQGIEPPMLKVCAAWWKSRGREPVAL